jgi:DNA repair protein RecN (Recombination protein N)
VNISVIKELGDRLIDIHSQHQNLYLGDLNFQFRFIDSLAKNADLLDKYRQTFTLHKKLQNEYSELLERSQKSSTEADFMQFQYDELEKAKLKKDEQPELEQELQMLSHVEEIKSGMVSAVNLLTGDENGIVVHLKDTISSINKIKNLYPKVSELLQRLESTYIEIKDIASETSLQAETIEFNNERIEEVKKRLDLIYSLCQKNRVNNEEELIQFRETLKAKLETVASYDDTLAKLKKELEHVNKELIINAEALHQSRKKIIPNTEEEINKIIKQLGMPYASFIIKVEKGNEFTKLGNDKVFLLFSANRQVAPQDISKVASGGEISRLMLAVKSVIASSVALPVIIFDEIDTGVSGEIADKMGNIMKSMSKNLQVISITHLPQVAAKGEQHYFVYKSDNEHTTKTHIKLLNNSERTTEIAKMLSGEAVSDAAIFNARELLKN